MKKLVIFAIAATATLCSCQKGAMKPALTNDVDTVSYEVGLANSNYVEGFLQQANLDSAYVEEFLAGLKEGILGSQDKKKLARYMGIMFGVQSNMQIEGLEKQLFGNDSTQRVSRRNYIAGIVNGVHGRSNLAIDGVPVDPQAAGMDVQGRIQVIRAKQFEANYQAGIEFLEKNAKEEGVQVLPSGVQYKVLAEGNGPKPTADQRVSIFYEGRLIDGTVFDSNYTQENAMPCVAGQMIPGFTEALCAMTVGSEWEVYIPAKLAYGDREMGGVIQPGSTLIFKIKLVSIDPIN